ncbi:uncharacterized protein LOC105212916 isoform X6 [Zeugodacus cucurbitae]|uniref:uncharacterized protein LOC105212916 isoform X6 n=1 Tax=Zeugodacus cucurbitae TaxID=28588 RepID=UPI000596931D|nr:uncharacterized protein LOC105212916 isoform X6 [Zeugodacus cucurbitae]
MISKLWILICATQLVIINGNYDPAFTGIKTRHHHRAYSTVEQEPYTNTQQQPPYESGPTTNYGNRNYGVSSVRLSNTYQHHDGAHTHQQPSYNHHHHQQPSQQQQQQHQQQQQTSQQVDAYQQRELPLYNRNAHVRHSPSPTQRSERRENVLSGVANTIPDYGTGCPPQHTGPVPYAYDCRRFVNCWHGRGHIQSCGPGTVFNPETLECDRPDKVVCGGSHTNGERREQQTTLQSATQQNKYRAGRLIDGSTDSVQSLCPNGFSGLAPHPTDCTKFLNCANGNTHVQNCGPGTAFSASKKVCDFKDKVDCSDRANAAYGASNNRDSRQYDEVFCPAGASGLYPHPYDCTRFLNCAHGQMAIQSCGPGTAFDPAKLICDFLHKVNCTSTTTIKRKSNLNYVDTSVKQNALEGEVAKEEGDIFCPPGVSGHFPYPFDYTKFINCKNGNTAIQNCVSGTAYSISRNYCESKENMPRTDHVAYIVSEVSYEYSLTIVSCPPSTDGRHLYPYDFTKYVSCRQGHMSIIACAAQNVYSFSERRCLPEHQVNIGDRVRSAWELQYNVEHTVSKSAALNHLNELLECPQGQTGLYPHPFDYKKYLQCLDGRLTIESCASGYVFSLSSKHCDPKDLVSSNELVQLTHDIGQITESAEENDYFSNNPGGIYLLCPQHVRGLFLYPFDCTKYLGCRDGQGQVENCVADKVFSISRRECINRNHVDAYDRVEYLSEVSHEFSTELKGTKNQLYEPNCLGLGADGLYPHAYDNTKFIKCVAGQATVEVCNNGMIFSKSRKYCDYARNVYEYDSGNDGYNTLTKDHWVQDNTNTLTKDHWVQDNTNTLSEGKTADDGIDVHIVCPPNSVGMYPHPNDCRKFFSCANGIAHIKDCSPGTAWSVEMEVCDFEKNVNCTGRTKPYTADDSVLTENKVSCPFNANGLFLHPFNAYQYIECTNGETSLRKCPPGSVFSISRRLCLVEEQVTNLDHVMCIQEYITDITLHYNYVICPANALGYFIYPFDGLLFIECKAGHTIIQNCGPNMLFSLSNMICIPSAEAKDTDHMWLSSVGQSAYNGFAAYDHSRDWGAVDTTGSGAHTLNIEHTVQTAACPADATGLYPHPTDCTKYLRCANGITYIMDCGPGTAFNAALEVCDFKEKVDCPHSVEFNNVALGHSRDPISQTIACPEGATGLYPHPLDCRKFLNCANGITNIQDCGPGTAWNAKLETCDFIKNVDCSDTHNVYGHNPNTNYQSPPAQSNYRGSTQIGWRQQYDEHSSSSQRGTANDRRAYGSGSSAGNHGDRWSNMDVQRPIPGDATYSGTYSADYDRQERLPTYGRELQQSSGSSDWIAAGSAIDRQTPTQSVIYEEGSLQPNREQHSLTTIPTQNSTHDTRTEFYSKNTRQESKTNSNWHNHEHSREFHRKHPNLLNPFNEDEQTTTHTHHRHSHNRAYHQRHPELPNPFATPEAPQSTTNFELSNTNVPNPHAESTTPFSVRPGTDVRVGDTDCQFDCGNGNCVKTHDVCNGINNCGNRKDEENCKHLGYEVRLTGGETSNMGRIEVKLLGKWGYVCDDKFGLSDAEVVCRELGFKLGASEVRGFSYYPPTTADVSFAMDEVECRGDEASLKECNFKGWGVSNCGPDEVVGVVCKVPQLKCPNNYWLCSTSQECIPPAFLCDNTPDCADKSDESENVCNSPIKYRLQGGPSPNEGRLEVRYRGEWGTVCDDDFGLKEAQVMCNSMGFYGTTTIVKNKYGPGSGPIWLDQVSCYGNETTLDQCNHFTWGEHNCNHTEDVGLKCTLGVPPQKIVTPPQVNDYENTQRELDETQQQLEDIGLFSEQWERKSKAVGEQRRCGQFKNDILDEYSHPEERVVNGSIAKRGHHPWQATIRTRGRGGISSHWCGAVLISSRHLLTAAHCLAGYPKGAYLVRLGDHYANIAESSEVDSFIENWYVHEKFRDATHMNNDIAVVVLKTPVKFNDYIQPVCLPNKGAALEENRKCTISGWGSIKSGVSTPSNILRAAELPILSDEVCKQKHVYGSSLTEGMFCAGYMDESVDACDGDSGGPLICHDEDGETLYGIISWGQHCGYANKPGVYVRVEKYVDWILEKINFSMQKNNKL